MAFGVIGGDQRQAEIARLLARDGHSTASYGLCSYGVTCGTLEEAAAADCVLLPLPLCGQAGVLNCACTFLKTADLFERFHPGQLLLAGQVQPEQHTEAAALGLRLTDYLTREELTVANAAATAEAAVQVAMEHLERALLGMDVLVVGFGRIGKLLCHRLSGIGARVTASARKRQDLAWICAYGWPALETGGLDGRLTRFGVVFNTVPDMVLEEKLLSQLSPDCLCIDLASQPGIDLAAAKRLGLEAVRAGQLPGRFLPRTAAAAILNTVYDIIRERGENL